MHQCDQYSEQQRQSLFFAKFYWSGGMDARRTMALERLLALLLLPKCASGARVSEKISGVRMSAAQVSRLLSLLLAHFRIEPFLTVEVVALPTEWFCTFGLSTILSAQTAKKVSSVHYDMPCLHISMLAVVILMRCPLFNIT